MSENDIKTMLPPDFPPVAEVKNKPVSVERTGPFEALQLRPRKSRPEPEHISNDIIVPGESIAPPANDEVFVPSASTPPRHEGEVVDPILFPRPGIVPVIQDGIPAAISEKIAPVKLDVVPISTLTHSTPSNPYGHPRLSLSKRIVESAQPVVLAIAGLAAVAMGGYLGIQRAARDASENHAQAAETTPSIPYSTTTVEAKPTNSIQEFDAGSDAIGLKPINSPAITPVAPSFTPTSATKQIRAQVDAVSVNNEFPYDPSPESTTTAITQPPEPLPAITPPPTESASAASIIVSPGPPPASTAPKRRNGIDVAWDDNAK